MTRVIRRIRGVFGHDHTVLRVDGYLRGEVQSRASVLARHDPAIRVGVRRDGFRQTSRYDDAIACYRRLAKEAEWIDYQPFGTSGEGRELPLLIASKDQAFTAAAKRARHTVSTPLYPARAPRSLRIGSRSFITLAGIFPRPAMWSFRKEFSMMACIPLSRQRRFSSLPRMVSHSGILPM